MYTYQPISATTVKALVLRLATVHANPASFQARIENMTTVYTRLSHHHGWSAKSAARAISGNATGRL